MKGLHVVIGCLQRRPKSYSGKIIITIREGCVVLIEEGEVNKPKQKTARREDEAYQEMY
jgi:hypothetical protein